MENIIDVVNKTREYWMIKRKTQFHHIIAQYITKMIRFTESQKIRRNLYELLGDPYNKEIFDKCNDNELIKCGLSLQQIITLRNISNLINEKDTIDDNLQRIYKIKGVGTWTIKSIRLILTDDHDIFLHEDSYIRSRLAELYNLNSLTLTQAKDIGYSWHQYRSTISMFLWRIKKAGIEKIKSGEILLREDFL